MCCYRAMAYEKMEGKKRIFKPSALSNTVIEGLKQIQNLFLSDNRKVKIKQNALRNDYKDGGLKEYKFLI